MNLPETPNSSKQNNSLLITALAPDDSDRCTCVLKILRKDGSNTGELMLCEARDDHISQTNIEHVCYHLIGTASEYRGNTLHNGDTQETSNNTHNKLKGWDLSP